MAKIPLFPILEKKYGISKMKSREELEALIKRLRSEDDTVEKTNREESDQC